MYVFSSVVLTPRQRSSSIPSDGGGTPSKGSAIGQVSWFSSSLFSVQLTPCPCPQSSHPPVSTTRIRVRVCTFTELLSPLLRERRRRAQPREYSTAASFDGKFLCLLTVEVMPHRRLSSSSHLSDGRHQKVVAAECPIKAASGTVATPPRFRPRDVDTRRKKVRPLARIF